jgi:hypothetical protein
MLQAPGDNPLPPGGSRIRHEPGIMPPLPGGDAVTVNTNDARRLTTSTLCTPGAILTVALIVPLRVAFAVRKIVHRPLTQSTFSA